ncbi:hypothetical protein ZWY2020_037268 [Hordeum vulgare]|nr:hypothetical protein ZWY2020_037268 [Hordeum vulgare]
MTAEELRTHRDGRYNIHDEHIFWDSKSFGDIINHHRRASVAAGNPVNPAAASGGVGRTGNMEEKEEDLYGDINESTNDGVFRDKEFVYHSDMDDYRTPSHGKMNKQKDNDRGHENSHAKVPYYCTPEYVDSFKGDRSDPIKVRDISDEKAVTSLETNEISSQGSGHSNGVDEQVEKVLGKRKRTAQKAVKSPFVVVKPIKHAKRSIKAILFNKEDVKKTSADVDVIKAYMGLNKYNTHWVMVVMHKEKEEFQVLDSSMGKELDSTARKLVEDLRREI